MKKITVSLLSLLCLAVVLVAAGCSKEEKTNSGSDANSGATTPEGEQPNELLIATWQLDLEESYSQILEYDDKKGPSIIDVVTSATTPSGGDDPTDGLITKMSEVYSSSSITFNADGTLSRTWTERSNGSSTTNTISYTCFGNTITMDGKKWYIVKLTENSLIMENTRIFMAKGKDVYSEFLHLEYSR